MKTLHNIQDFSIPEPMTNIQFRGADCIFNIPLEDPKDCGRVIFPANQNKRLLRPGLTVIVGDNGTGKSTLMDVFADILDDNKLPYARYSDTEDGRSRNYSYFLEKGNVDKAALRMTSSEGENIAYNFFDAANQYRAFINKYKREIMKIRHCFFLLDGIDSGTSIATIDLFKTLVFKDLLDVSSRANVILYIIATANNYEMARNERCIDVNTGDEIVFRDYEHYREYIMERKHE